MGEVCDVFSANPQTSSMHIVCGRTALLGLSCVGEAVIMQTGSSISIPSKSALDMYTFLERVSLYSRGTMRIGGKHEFLYH